MKNIFHKILSFTLVLLIANTTTAQEEPKPQFTPPKIITIIRPFNHGLAPSDSITTPIDYIIDRGQDANINTGDTLNVYRKEIVNRNSETSCMRPGKVFT